MDNWYKFLDEDIISYIIGDKELEPMLGFISIRMPYMSGKDICQFGNELGSEVNYDGTKSRKEYIKEVIKYCIGQNKMSIFLNKILDLQHFKKDLKNLNINDITYQHNEIKMAFIERVNGILMFDNLFLNFNHNNYILKSLNDDNLEVISEEVKKFSKNYAHDMFKKALVDINNTDYDSSITKIRTMIEEILIEGLKLKGIQKDYNGDIKSQYKDFKNNYQMHIDKDMDSRIKKLLSGLETIVDSIAEMRNANSDSHGVGDKRVKIEKHHALLYYNSGVTLAEFLLSIINK